MNISSLKKHLSRFKWRGIKGVGKDTGGISAVEFALIAPVMVLLYYGGIELSLLMQANRKITNVTATIGDLASRATILTNDDIDAVFDSARILSAPLDNTQIQMRLTSVAPTSNDAANPQPRVVWSDGRHTTARAVGSSVEGLPDDLVPIGGSIIVAEVTFDYESGLDFLPAAERTLSDRFYLRPRRTNQIVRVPN